MSLNNNNNIGNSRACIICLHEKFKQILWNKNAALYEKDELETVESDANGFEDTYQPTTKKMKYTNKDGAQHTTSKCASGNNMLPLSQNTSCPTSVSFDLVGKEYNDIISGSMFATKLTIDDDDNENEQLQSYEEFIKGINSKAISEQNMTESDSDIAEKQKQQTTAASLCTKEVGQEATSAWESMTLKQQITCKLCHLVQYCSEAHRFADWPEHSNFCKLIAKIKQKKGGQQHVQHILLLNGTALNKKLLDKTIKQLLLSMYSTLHRCPTKREMDLICFPAYCACCYKLSELRHCKKCFAISYCSEEHCSLYSREHEKNCSKLKLCYAYNEHLPLDEFSFEHFYMPVYNVKHHNLREILQFGLQIHLPNDDDDIDTFDEYYQLAQLSSFSYICSLCLALSYLEKKSCLDKKPYIIFIVNANDELLKYFLKIHVLFLIFQNNKLKNVIFYFIGADMNCLDDIEAEFVFRQINRKINFKFYKGTFKKFKSTAFRLKPTLVIIFNADFASCNKVALGAAHYYYGSSSFYAQTEYVITNTLKDLVEIDNLPIFITARTAHQCQMNHFALTCAANKSLINKNLLRITDVMRNPYSSLCPQRCMQCCENEAICYDNGYIQGFYSILNKRV